MRLLGIFFIEDNYSKELLSHASRWNSRQYRTLPVKTSM